MHRLLTIFGLAIVVLGTHDCVLDATAAEVTATVYVGRHYEVRDHDQPVKYVFADATRVARITGSLSANERIQRLRLYTGWNLIALAVTAADFRGQVEQFNESNGLDPLLRAAYRWRSSAGDYTSIAPGELVAAGSVLWLHARTNHVVGVRGNYEAPSPPTIPTNGGFTAGFGLEAWPVQLPPNVTIWKFAGGGAGWQAGLPGDLAPLGNISRQIAPGEAIYVHSSESIQLSIPRPESRVAYYHQDHLGSSSVITDGAGNLLEETVYHPFGAPRYQSRSGEVDAFYGFTQKERDRESSLHYFEARYLAGPLARFLSFDPLVQRLDALEPAQLKNLLVHPTKLNPFAYALNNPVRYNDPDGHEARPRPTEAKPNPYSKPNPNPRPTPSPKSKSEEPEPDLTIRIGAVAKGSEEISAFSFSMTPSTGSGQGANGSGGGTGKASFSEFQITISADVRNIHLLGSEARGAPIRSMVLVVPNKDREYRIYLTDVLVVSSSIHDSAYDTPLQTFSLNAGGVRFGDPDPPQPSDRESIRSWSLHSLLRQ